MLYLNDYDRILAHLQQDEFKKHWFTVNQHLFKTMSSYEYITLVNHLENYLDIFKNNNVLKLGDFAKLLTIQLGNNKTSCESVTKILSLGLDTGCFKLDVDPHSEVYIYLNYPAEKQPEVPTTKVINLQEVLTQSYC